MLTTTCYITVHILTAVICPPKPYIKQYMTIKFTFLIGTGRCGLEKINFVEMYVIRFVVLMLPDEIISSDRLFETVLIILSPGVYNLILDWFCLAC